MTKDEGNSKASSWNVHKFGGTSVQNAECIRKVGSILSNLLASNATNGDLYGGRIAIVVSAFGGSPKVTQLLLDSLQLAVKGGKWDQCLDIIREKHATCIRELELNENAGILDQLERDFQDLRTILRTVSLIRHYEPSIEGYVAGFGEQWSALIMSHFLGQEWEYVDAREVLLVKHSAHESNATVQWQESRALFEKRLEKVPEGKNLIITGYIATDADTGGATTLGRDGSDHSASIFGVLLKAAGITIWTDVSGVMSADPRRVKDAYVLEKISYSEASELAYFGAKVIHPKTMQPAAEHDIPLYIKNTFYPDDHGTEILATCEDTLGRTQVVCGFSTVDNIALIDVVGKGMMGVPGVVTRTLGVVARNNISITLIAQASSEQTICFAVPFEHGELLRKHLLDEFRDEVRAKDIDDVKVIGPCSIVAAVGDAMTHTCGVAGQFFSALGAAGVNVLACAQGPSEKNISAVIMQDKAGEALQGVHSVFKAKWPINMVVIGSAGMIQAVTDEIERIENGHETINVFDLRVFGVLTVRSPVYSDTSSTPRARNQGPSHDIEDVTNLIDAFLKTAVPHPIIIDATLDPRIAALHAEWLSRDIHVITSNVHACGHPDPREWEKLKKGRKPVSIYSANTGVTGGLAPALRTIQRLVTLGNAPDAAECLVSPAVSAILSLMQNEGMTQIEAIDAVCAHPESADMHIPDELSGMLASRRMLIIAREMGFYHMSLEDIAVERIPNTIPAPKEDSVWRYVGRINKEGKGTLKLEQLPKNSELARTQSGLHLRLFPKHNEHPIIIDSMTNNQSAAQGLLWNAINIGPKLHGSRQYTRRA